MSAQPNTRTTLRHAGPHLGMLAIVYTLLFNAGLCAVSAFGIPFGVKQSYWPGPWEPPNVIVSYFQAHSTAALICVFLQTGAFMTVFNGVAAGFTVWAMIHPGVTQDVALTTALYYLSYAFGGPGFSVPMGLLMAGVCIPAALRKLLPTWVVAFGLLMAIAGELSWFNLVFPKALFLIPLVRFPGFIWLIATGFMLPSSVAQPSSPGEVPA